MLHTFALIHDDVMDRSANATRRSDRAAPDGRPNCARSDDADWFGMSAAILAGDLAFVWADQMFDERGRTAPGGVSTCGAVPVRSTADRGDRRAVSRPPNQRRTDGHRTDALRVALLKSARYTVSRPLQIGAALAGADDGLCEQLERYGDAVGLAFQLRDDILGLFGSTAATGKPRLDDLREGKAHGADGACTRPRPADRSRRARAGARLPDLDERQPHGAATSWPDRARWPRSKRRSTFISHAAVQLRRGVRRTRPDAAHHAGPARGAP